MMLSDPRRILTLREVARQASFSRAAEALSLTQPAVSQQIAALEREVGAALLVRSPGGVSATPAGELLLRHAEAIGDRLDLARAQLDELVSGEAARLRVGAFPSALATIVPAALVRLTQERPLVKVDATEGGTEALAGGVRAGDLHAAVCFQDAAGARREHPGSVREDVAEEAFDAVLPPGHPLGGAGPIRRC